MQYSQPQVVQQQHCVTIVQVITLNHASQHDACFKVLSSSRRNEAKESYFVVVGSHQLVLDTVVVWLADGRDDGNFACKYSCRSVLVAA